MVQETHLNMERKLALEKMFAGKIRIFHSPHPERATQKEGVAIVVNRRLLRTEGAVETIIVPGRAIQVALPYQDGERGTLNLLCVYAPTSEGEGVRRRFFESVRKYYDENQTVARPDLMGGDFNNVEDPIDRIPVSQSADSSIEELDALKMSVDMMLVDGWRATFPTERAYTFMRGSGNAVTMSRLDRIYMNAQTFQAARAWKIHEGGSDRTIALCRPVFPSGMLRDRKLAGQMKERGQRASRDIQALERTGARSAQRNPQLILARLKRDWMEMAREREKQVVPRLLAEIQAREKALKASRFEKCERHASYNRRQRQGRDTGWRVNGLQSIGLACTSRSGQETRYEP
ncbi:DNase I-like protein [Daedaleopsis nitida]|nr:DNase I-like protein [Daedaleopsis nitida]